MAKQLTITIANVANILGRNDRLERESTLVLHRAWVKKSDEDKAADRKEWNINYVAGNLGITVAKAEAIIDTPRPQRSQAQQQAYDRARQQYRYHVERPQRVLETNSAQGANTANLRVISKALKAANKRQIAEVLELLAELGLVETE